jgi:hypothetical protein
MKDSDNMIAKDEALRQIRLGLRRAAFLYHFFAKTLTDELGESQGRDLIRKAIDAYGEHIGREARRRADERGLSPTPENFESDLPTLAWEMERVVVDGEERVRVQQRPLAEEWLALGEPGKGRLYCFVDQAKMQGFNPDYEYVHTRNVLDGDPYCELVVRPVKRKVPESAS